MWNQPWFWPVAGVTVGFPLLLVLCTELTRSLERRGSRSASIVRLIRNFALPLGALLVLLSQIDNLDLEVNWSRIVATAFGFVLILIVINMLNFAIFATAERGSWRQRVPSIFIDIIKLVVIVMCFALLFQWVWGADVGGLFTALGVTSIVIGLALQNAAGSVVSGLLLLFEQPFKLGDWLETGSVRGRVVEVNWRAVHIDTGNGTHVVPTATLAGASFTNLSRVTDSYEAHTTLTFAKTDAPSDVAELIRAVAQDLPLRLRDTPVEVTPGGAGSYHVAIAVSRPADEGPTIALLLAWLWFAARRAHLHLDGETGDTAATPERQSAALARVIQRLGLSAEEDVAALNTHGLKERFGAGEALTRRGSTAQKIHFIIDGEVALLASIGGLSVQYLTLGAPEAVGLGVYTHQSEPDTARALSVVTTISVPAPVLEELVDRHPRLALELGHLSDNRREALRETQEKVLAKAQALGQNRGQAPASEDRRATDTAS